MARPIRSQEEPEMSRIDVGEHTPQQVVFWVQEYLEEGEMALLEGEVRH